MQAGRSVKARKAAQSHTGALIGDCATMRTQVEDAGAIVVPTMDEMMDLVEILVRFPNAAHQGPRHPHRVGRLCRADQRFRRGHRIRSAGARAGHAEEGQEGCCRPMATTAIRSTSPPASRRLASRRGQGADRRSQCRNAVHLVSDQPAVPVKAFNKGMADSPKPKVMVALGDTWQLGPDVMEAVKQSPAVFRARRTACCAPSRFTPAMDECWRAPRAAAARADHGDAQVRQGRAARMAGQENARRRRHRVPAGELARTATKPRQWPSASAIRWC